MAIWALGWLLFTFLGSQNGAVSAGDSRNCGFPAIFNFGDSNSDTGESSSAFGEMLFPQGVTLGKKFKRVCDGLLIIDFIAEYLGLPYLNSTLDSIGTSYKHGANFATGGSKMNPVVHIGDNPFHLDVQISQFLLFKSRVTTLYNQSNNIQSNNPTLKSILPEPEVFSKALYTFDIGQNDMQGPVDFSTLADSFFNSIQRLVGEGAKFLWVHNTGPPGCLPHYKCDPSKPPCVVEELGCEKSLNDKAQEFNKQLKDRVYKLRAQYPDAVITYVDMYTAKYTLISKAKEQGFEDPFKYCCGKPGVACGLRVGNGNKPVSHEKGKLVGTACDQPSKYISWDGVHFSEAANKFLAQLIVNGSLSDPPIPIAQACHKP